jgi:hypothetical protein
LAVALPRIEVIHELPEHDRKAWLFSYNVNGAAAIAKIYSLVETAKLNGKEPYTWLRHLLEWVPFASSVEATNRRSRGTACQ